MTKNISITALENLLAAGGVNLVDVRESDEFAAGHVPGAVNVPLSELENRLAELDKETSYHLICQMGGRSLRAAAFLDGMGYDVTSINSGTEAWTGELEK